MLTLLNALFFCVNMDNFYLGCYSVARGSIYTEDMPKGASALQDLPLYHAQC